MICILTLLFMLRQYRTLQGHGSCRIMRVEYIDTVTQLTVTNQYINGQSVQSIPHTHVQCTNYTDTTSESFLPTNLECQEIFRKFFETDEVDGKVQTELGGQITRGTGDVCKPRLWNTRVVGELCPLSLSRGSRLRVIETSQRILVVLTINN